MAGRTNGLVIGALLLGLAACGGGTGQSSVTGVGGMSGGGTAAGGARLVGGSGVGGAGAAGHMTAGGAAGVAGTVAQAGNGGSDASEDPCPDTQVDCNGTCVGEGSKMPGCTVLATAGPGVDIHTGMALDDGFVY